MIRRAMAVGSALVALHGSAWSQETIKIGLMTIDSGPFAIYKRNLTESAVFAVDTINAQGGVLGRKLELIEQSFNGTPADAVASATKLTRQAGVSFLTGFTHSAAALALSAKLNGLDALLIDTISSTDELVGKYCQANYFRVTPSDKMNMNALRSVVQQSGAKTWNILVADYAAGHDFAKGFAAMVKEQGGTVQVTLFAPLSTTDFGNQISQLVANPADGLAVMFPGAGGITLAKQQAPFGMLGKYKVTVSTSTTNDSVIGAQGDTTVGMYSVQGYMVEMTGEKGLTFVRNFEARYKRKPTYGDVDTYLGYEMLAAAISKAKSTDTAAVRAAFSGLKTNTLVGDVEMRAIDHQAQRPLAIVQVAKAGEGKGVIAYRWTEAAAKVSVPPNPECKL